MKVIQKDPKGQFKTHLTYDRFNHVDAENSPNESSYKYHSIGNCVQKNEQTIEANTLNQVTHNGESEYSYDLNGNLIAQTNPLITYQYHALNRLILQKQEHSRTRFKYDSFGRSIKIQENEKIKTFFT